MSKTYGQDCVIAKSLDIFGERWTMLIIRDLFLGKKTYTDFQVSLKGISPNLLVERLKDLEVSGIINRKIEANSRPPKVEYSLTAKGRGLGKVLSSIVEWGAKNLSGSNHSVGLFHKNCGGQIDLGYHCEACERNVMMSELTITRSIGADKLL